MAGARQSSCRALLAGAPHAGASEIGSGSGPRYGGVGYGGHTHAGPSCRARVDPRGWRTHCRSQREPLFAAFANHSGARPRGARESRRDGAGCGSNESRHRIHGSFARRCGSGIVETRHDFAGTNRAGDWAGSRLDGESPGSTLFAWTSPQSTTARGRP